jgi:raffinose/stachyose/melibiose transport system permease protein
MAPVESWLMISTPREKWTIPVFFVISSVIILLPIAAMLPISLHQPTTTIGLSLFPDMPTFDSYRVAWKIGRFGSRLQTSIIVSVTVTTAVVGLSVFAGYGLSFVRGRLRQIVIVALLVGLVFPLEVCIISLFVMIREMGISDTLAALILPQVSLGLSFGVLLMNAGVRSLPLSIFEASELEGASSFQTLRYVVIPMVTPAIVVLIVLQFLWSWNEFLIPLVFATDDRLLTAPVGLSVFQGRRRTDLPSLTAAAVFVALPPVLVYMFGNRALVRRTRISLVDQ